MPLYAHDYTPVIQLTTVDNKNLNCLSKISIKLSNPKPRVLKEVGKHDGNLPEDSTRWLFSAKIVINPVRKIRTGILNVRDLDAAELIPKI